MQPSGSARLRNTQALTFEINTPIIVGIEWYCVPGVLDSPIFASFAKCFIFQAGLSVGGLLLFRSAAQASQRADFTPLPHTPCLPIALQLIYIVSDYIQAPLWFGRFAETQLE